MTNEQRELSGAVGATTAGGGSGRLRTRQACVVGAGLVMIGLMATALLIRGDDPLRSRERRGWRDRAIGEIEGRVADKGWVEGEVGQLTREAATRPVEGGWVGEDVLVMGNGEWVVCRSVCGKDGGTAVKKDLFVGRGSDGKWYYSTFHFCVGKCVLQVERQPASLADFVEGYWLMPFDPGKREEALRVTWEGGVYGEAKVGRGAGQK